MKREEQNSVMTEFIEIPDAGCRATRLSESF
jgi:hypothetical protein